MRRRRPYLPSPSVAEPRRHLLVALRAFVRSARDCAGVRRLALVGSLTTTKAVPSDADVLVTSMTQLIFTQLALAGRRLKGAAQNINLGADIFLADQSGDVHRPHLSLSGMSPACPLPGAALRSPRSSQRRPARRHSLARTDSRAAGRPLAQRGPTRQRAC